ncbi:hypothetical protein DL546_003351 [Coniochaeta pulveracea]|nr:hypothetical protein DL546_003351 [Coniochaeta pulveracea]
MSDEVSDFLRSVEELKERREQEDEARSRELEEKFLQERAERQARRAERARSISPQKSSPANTPPPPSRGSISSRPIDGFSLLASSPRLNSPRSPAIPNSSSGDAMGDASDFAKEIDSVFDGESSRLSTGSVYSMGVPSRAPLSWARRPGSISAERPPSRNRPLSQVAAENAAVRTSTPTDQPSSDQSSSRDQISQALAGKDPTWFRQTADRGQSSAAYRKNQVEDPDTLDMSSMRAQLPGMSREISTEPIQRTPDTGATSPPSRLQSKLGSPFTASPVQRLEPSAPVSKTTAERDGMHSGRASPTRPVSPTKGMGGFVQSAMMKRSDSVKRWSVNSPAGLQRADSVVSSRPGHTRSRSTFNNSTLREESVTPTTSRPTSSYGPKELEVQEKRGSDKEEKLEEQPAPTSTKETREEDSEQLVPLSPSKTMDPRRWSPTKSSWLDAQLNKTESPKQKAAVPASTQPAWMVQLKAQKTGGDGLDRTASVARKHEVQTGGLMRAPAMGANVKPGPMSPPLPSEEKFSVSNLRENLVKRPSQTSSREVGDSTAAAKVKPVAPPKKDLDFRGNLKPRQAPTSEASGPPEEFKAVFGTLRRTKTQNYVAPDELKNNILRGKAGLNNTGGPQPSERKDEFKEAILKKKEDFKKAQQEGQGLPRGPSNPGVGEKPLPEALAKKLGIKRSATVSKRDSAPFGATPEKPSVPTGVKPPFSRKESSEVSSLTSPKPSVSENEPLCSPPTLHKEVSAPARLQGRVAGGIAERFNPALAGMLARGPPAAGSTGGKSTAEPASQPEARDSEPEKAPGSGPQLTHMTKSRARGPKRKAPSSVARVSAVAKVSSQDKPASQETSEPTAQAPAPAPTSAFKTPPLRQLEKFEPRPVTPKVVDPVKPIPSPKPRVLSPLTTTTKLISEKNTVTTPISQRISLISSPKQPGDDGSRPANEFETRARSPTKLDERVAALAAKAHQSSKPIEKDEPVQPLSPKKSVLKRISKFLDEPAQVDGPADLDKSLPPSPTKSLPASPVKARAGPQPVPAVSAADEKKSDDKVDAEPVASVRNGVNLFGGAPRLGNSTPASVETAAPAPEPTPKTVQRPRTPPQLSIRPLPAPPVLSPPETSPVHSPMTKYNMEVSAMLTNFFGQGRPKRAYNVDAADILMRRPQNASRITTLQSQLFQLSGDGKKVPIPGHHERVLFEQEMYLCTHTFSTGTGRKESEVYFWTGDEVPESAVQDAQLFAQREARSYGGKLIKLAQGKESPEFLQALGGIVAVRRGSSNKYDSLAPHMLCGRRYHGQITFDEVDFTPNSLCSGFPYLITQQGKCYLWKGKGSDVDELSSARLIGMDLALMGELEEIEDGAEPASFWYIFEGGARRGPLGSADHWRLKPGYDKYCGRLFKSDLAIRQQIIEITPFSQADLHPTGIYILDAFFEMYIIVGAQAKSEYAAFHNALEFAQEYAILASSMEDRPFVPISTVVLEGIPRDLKSVFRKWRDNVSPTIMHPPSNTRGPGLKRGRSLRVVPLNQALQALRE